MPLAAPARWRDKHKAAPAMPSRNARKRPVLARLDRAVALLNAEWACIAWKDRAHTPLLTSRAPAKTCASLVAAWEASPTQNGTSIELARTCEAAGVVLRSCDAGEPNAAILLFGFTPGGQQHPSPALFDLVAEELAAHLAGDEMASRVDRIKGHLALIRGLGQRVTSTKNRADLFVEITRVIHEALGFEHIQLLLIDDKTNRVRLAHASGRLAPGLLAAGFDEPVASPGIIGHVARTGSLWVSADVTQDTHFVSHALLPNTASEIALPLRLGERIIGVLDVQSDKRAAFREDDIFVLQTVADQIAPALEQNRLFTAERQERELADTLADVSRIICSTLNLDEVLDSVLNQLDRVLQHRGARVTLRGLDDVMRVAAAKGYRDIQMAKRSTFAIHEAPLSRPVLEEQQTIIVTDARRDPRWYWQMGASQIRSWCAAPLVIRGEAIGWLCVDWPEPHFYHDEHARIIRAFADQAVVAIENARLYSQIKQSAENLETNVATRTRELREARDEITEKAEQLRALVRRVVEIQEAERQRIAIDLHDGVSQSILAAIYELQALRLRLKGDNGDADGRVDGCQKLLEMSLQDMKQIIYALRPHALDEFGLIPALESLSSSIQLHHNLRTSFHVGGVSFAMPPEMELAIYRMVQEAFQNAVRHAEASEVALTVDFASDNLALAVSDNGIGFSAEAVRGGLGLMGMRERVQALDGDLTIDTAPGRGTSINLVIPRRNWDDKD